MCATASAVLLHHQFINSTQDKMLLSLVPKSKVKHIRSQSRLKQTRDITTIRCNTIGDIRLHRHRSTESFLRWTNHQLSTLANSSMQHVIGVLKWAIIMTASLTT